ncbi:unnamed protein product [Medioppia subpectinata]|uniref:Uncharacterized protein n=1 Tax=Medioppia subpectinata TaxID=1979941 RepID=A0A7R9Q6B7_9ACAR|nr:unnamed protein product [Medioppia subpectinata]CAG2113704.1 unnamed protein product [Medioppia subpectinata]
MFIKITLIVAVLLALWTIAYGQDCSPKGMKRFDITMARLVTIANSGRKFPEAKGTEMKKWCDESDVLTKELETYKQKCFKDLSKQVFGVMIYSIKNTLRSYCKSGKKQDSLLKATPCLNHNDPLVTKCYTSFIDGLLGAQNANDTKKIPYLCCEYVKIFPCFDEKLSPAPKCNQKGIDFVSDLIRSIAGNVVDLICGDYVEGSDKCTHLGPPPKKSKKQRRLKSFAVPVLDLLSSFPEV